MIWLAVCGFLVEQLAAKALEACHQPHGFLSLTYTQAVTCNVLHKLTARQDRGGPQRLSSGGSDGSPQHLHEILLTAQPFDLVLSCPLLASITQVFHTVSPPPSRWTVKECRSAGQPMKGCAFTSSRLPLIYVNTSVIRVFCPLQDSGELPDMGICLCTINTSTRFFIKYLKRHKCDWWFNVCICRFSPEGDDRGHTCSQDRVSQHGSSGR